MISFRCYNKSEREVSYERIKSNGICERTALIDSPTGYTKAVIDFYEKEVKALGYETIHTNKGNLIVKVPGMGHDTKALCTTLIL